MARNFNDLIDGTLIRLGSPRAQCPSEDQCLRQVSTHIRTLLRSKQNVSMPWNFAETTVEITPGEDTYQITEASFGTPLVVTTVPENDAQTVRIVPFYCPQNLDYSWGYPVNAGNFIWPAYEGSNCTAARCAIFWQSNLPYIRFQPTPQISPASYKIQYLQSANAVGVASLTSTPLQDQDCDLVEARAALSLLALTEWDGSNDKRNAEKRKDLLVTLTTDERLLREQFDIANRIMVGPRISNRWSVVDV